MNSSFGEFGLIFLGVILFMFFIISGNLKADKRFAELFEQVQNFIGYNVLVFKQ